METNNNPSASENCISKNQHLQQTSENQNSNRSNQRVHSDDLDSNESISKLHALLKNST